MLARLAALAVLFAAGASLCAPVALAASALVEPAQAQPGDELILFFQSDATLPVDVAIQDAATCTMVAPDGAESEPCAGTAELLDVRLTPGAKTWRWVLFAPEAPGNYSLTFRRDAALSLPPSSDEASAVFEVIPLDPSRAAGEPGPVGALPPVDEPLAGAQTPGQSADDSAPRWLASATLSGATLTVICAGIRLRSGGRP